MSRQRAAASAAIAVGMIPAALYFVCTVYSQPGLQVGYAVITPQAGTRVPVASALFSLRSGGALASEAGVGAVVPIRRGRIFVDQRGTATSIALANPSDAEVEAALSLRDVEGQLLCPGSATVPRQGHLAKNVGELLPGCSLPAIGSLTFEVNDADPGLAAIAIRTSFNPAGVPIFATLPVLELDSRAGTASLVFPRIGAGQVNDVLKFSTQLILLNPGEQTAEGVIRLFANDGSALRLNLVVDESLPAGTLSGGTASEFDFSLQPHAVLRGTLDFIPSEMSPPEMPLPSTGYAVVESAQGEALSGTAIFQFRDGGDVVISEAGVGAPLASRRVRLFVDTVQTRTGIAFTAAGSQQPARLTFELFNRFGQQVALKETVPLEIPGMPDLPAGGHGAVFVDELFGAALPADFRRGVIEIRSNIPIFFTGLKFTFNADSGGQPILTTLPLADLYTPIHPPFVVLPQIGFGVTDGLEFATRLILINQDDQKGITGKLRFGRFPSVHLYGRQGSEFDYLIHAGGAASLPLGDTATVSRIALPQAQGAEIAVALAAPQAVMLRPQVTDSANQLRYDFIFQYISFDCSVAEVDRFGRIEARKEGFSTLIVSAGGISLAGCLNEPAQRQGNSLAAPRGAAQQPLAIFTISVSSVSGVAGAVDVRGVVQDGFNRFYLTSPERHSVLRAEDVNTAPQVFAGTESPGFQNGTRQMAQFNQPAFLAFEALPARQSILYVSDSGNNIIRAIKADQPDGQVSTLARGFDDPQGIALDGLGNLWVVDAGSATIQRIQLNLSPNLPVVETIAGSPDDRQCLDGVGSETRFGQPVGISKVPRSAAEQLRDVFGNFELTMLVADRACGLRLIQQQDLEGTVWNVATLDVAAPPHSRSGALFVQRLPFGQPEAAAADLVGNVFVSRPGQAEVNVLLTTGETVPATQPGVLTEPQGLSLRLLRRPQGDFENLGRVAVADEGTGREIAYGAPVISEVEVVDRQGNIVDPPVIGIQGGDSVTVRGRNFARESFVLIEGNVIRAVVVEDTSTIRFNAPSLPAAGRQILTVRNRGGSNRIFLSIGTPAAIPALSMLGQLLLSGLLIWGGCQLLLKRATR